MVWQKYTSEELNWQYNPRRTMPDFAKRLGSFPGLAEEARAQLSHQLDIRYGPGPKETFDLFPAIDGGPVHIFFHGGYWRAEDKANHSFVAKDLVSEGINVVVANYDLCPDVTVGEINEQAARCVANIHENAADLNLDPDRITVSGHSAGGQIVAKLCAHEVAGPLIKASLTISGVFDLEPFRHTEINEGVGVTEGQAIPFSPIHDEIRTKGRISIAVGGAETEEFHRQSEDYAAKCRAASFSVESNSIGQADHLTVLQELFYKDRGGYPYLLQAITL